jgi:hypothetical protein
MGSKGTAGAALLSRQPTDRILEKAKHLKINTRIRQKLATSATGFAFQGR